VRSFAVRSRRRARPGKPGASAFGAAQFLRLAGQPGRAGANPAKGIAAPKIPRHLPKNIDVDDVNRLLDIDLNDPLAVRDRAMLEVMYGAGCVCPSWSILISNTSIWKAARCG
jgi:integrase/recombinase XerC